MRTVKCATEFMAAAHGERQGKSLSVHQGRREVDLSQSTGAAAEAALRRRLLYSFRETDGARRARSGNGAVNAPGENRPNSPFSPMAVK